jgi:hypothetical protein
MPEHTHILLATTIAFSRRTTPADGLRIDNFGLEITVSEDKVKKEQNTR